MTAKALLAKFLTDPDSSIAIIRRLFTEVFRDHYRGYGMAIACMAVGAAATAGTALLMRHVVNDVFVDRQLTTMWVLAAAVVGLSVAKGFAAYGQSIMLGRIGTGIIAGLQRRIFDKILTLGVDYFSRRHSSQLVTRISHNARAARDVVNTVSMSLGRDLLTVIGLAAVMVYQDPVMSLIALSVAPPIILGVTGIVRRIRALSNEEYKSLAGIMATAQETIQGIRIVKSFTLEDRMRERLGEAVAQAEWRSNALTRIQASRAPLMETLGGLSVGLVLIYAGWQTISDNKSPGEFMAFITAFLLAYEPAKRLAGLNISLQRSLSGVRLMYELLDMPEREPDVPGAIELGRAKGSLVLTDVTFGYNKEKQVLHDVSIEATPGSVVALVGPSGAGKTTIISLIQRFFDPWSGSIAIDGMDVRTVTIASLRHQISFVSQDTFLFSGTIRDNIAFGLPGASDEEIEAAADAANARDFIDELPDKFDTTIGENGSTFSGGQRQRLAIARAILKDAPILILDEATSSLDTLSERQVQSALERLMRGRTTIIVAHRLSTIAKADRTYVVDEGRVVESGSHGRLIADNRLYARLFGSSEAEITHVGADNLAKEWEVTP